MAKKSIIDDIKSQCVLTKQTWFERLPADAANDFQEVKSAWHAGEFVDARISGNSLYEFLIKRHPHAKVGQTAFRRWLKSK